MANGNGHNEKGEQSDLLARVDERLVAILDKSNSIERLAHEQNGRVRDMESRLVVGDSRILELQKDIGTLFADMKDWRRVTDERLNDHDRRFVEIEKWKYGLAVGVAVATGLGVGGGGLSWLRAIFGGG